MKKFLLLLVAAAFPLLAVSSFAQTIKLPKDSPVVAITVPESWKPEDTDNGFYCESPDEAATVIFEVADAKKMDALIDQNADWLEKEHKVEIDKSSQVKTEFESGGMKWSLVTFDGKDEVYGPATIMLAFADTGKDQMLMVTYWVTKEGEKTHAKELDGIFKSVKKVE